MPFLVRWPAGIESGTHSDAMALNVDFAPTFLDAAGLPIPIGGSCSTILTSSTICTASRVSKD